MKKSRWIKWIIYKDDSLCAERLALALDNGAEVYLHGGPRPHYHCMAYGEGYKTLREFAATFGLRDGDFNIPAHPDATRRYMRNGGVRLYA